MRSSARFLASQTTTVVTVKTGPTELTGWSIFNPSNATAYVQLFDLPAAGDVTLATTVPDMAIGLTTLTASNERNGEAIWFPHGLQLACTTTATGNTAPNTGLHLTLFVR